MYLTYRKYGEKLANCFLEFEAIGCWKRYWIYLFSEQSIQSFLSVKIFQYFGYYATYGTSLGFVILGNIKES